MDFIRSCDAMGVYVGLNNKGNRKFRTICGGITTIIIFILMIIFFVLLLGATKENDTVELNSTSSTGSTGGSDIEFEEVLEYRKIENFYSLTDSTENLYFFQGGWSFALMVISYDPNVFVMQAYTVENIQGSYNFVYYEMVECDSSNFHTETIDDKDFSSAFYNFMYCPDLASSGEYSAYGDPYSSSTKQFYLEILTCSATGNENCYDDDTTQTMLDNIQIMLTTANSYYDHSDQNDPIKKYLSLSPTINLNLGKVTLVNIPIIGTEIRFLNGTTETIYRTGEIEFVEKNYSIDVYLSGVEAIPSSERYIYEQYVSYQPVMEDDMRQLGSESVEVEEYEKENPLYKLFFIMAQLGGFYSFLKLVFGGIYEKFYNNMMIADILNRFNSVNGNKPNGHINGSKIMPEEEKQPNLEVNDMEMSHEGGSSDLKKNSNEHDQVRLIQNNTIARARNQTRNNLYEYSGMDAFKYSLKCSKEPVNLHEMGKEPTSKLDKFEADLARFNSESDIVRIVTSIHETKQALNSVIKTLMALQEEGQGKGKSSKSKKSKKSKHKNRKDGIVYEAQSNTAPQSKDPVQNINKIIDEEIDKMVDMSGTSNNQNYMNEGGSIIQQLDKSLGHLDCDESNAIWIKPPNIANGDKEGLKMTKKSKPK